MNINRSGYYKWLNRRSNPSQQEMNRRIACDLFNEYHNKFPNLILAELNLLRPFQIVVTDMIVFGKQTLL